MQLVKQYWLIKLWWKIDMRGTSIGELILKEILRIIGKQGHLMRSWQDKMHLEQARVFQYRGYLQFIVCK